MTTKKEASKKETAAKGKREAKSDTSEAGGSFGPSGANELRDNSTTAAEIAGAVSGGDAKGGAQSNATSIDAANEQLEAKEEQSREDEDKSFAGKVRRSELFFVNAHSTGEQYVGVTPQRDPNASDAVKRRSTVETLDKWPPRTGMEVRPKDGQPFSVPDGFGTDTRFEDWGRVTTPDGQPLFG